MQNCIRHFVWSRHIGFAADQYAHASTARVLLTRKGTCDVLLNGSSAT